MTRLPPIAAALALAGCATASASSPRHREGPVAIGQAAYVNGLTVTPLRVVEDSRCPMNARCIWAGRVVLHLRIIAGRGGEERDLIFGTPVHVADGMLSLTAVTPVRLAGRPVRPGDYRFSFAFEGGL